MTPEQHREEAEHLRLQGQHVQAEQHERVADMIERTARAKLN